LSSIVLSAATRSSLLAAQDTAALMAQTQQRLATGKKVNSALDNPTNFFTAAGLDARAGDLSALLDGISNGVQTIQSASTGITSIQKLVDTAKSIANQALSDKSASTTGTPARAATYTGSVGYAGTGTASATGTQDFSGTHNVTFSVNDGTNTTTITLDAAHLTGAVPDLTKVSAQDAVDAINNQLSTNGGAAGTAAAVKATLTSDGRITFTSTAVGAAAKVNLSAIASSDVDIGLGIPAGTGSTRTAATAFATQTFSSLAAKLKVTDASGRVTNINLDSTAGGGTLTDTSTATDVVAAINAQLSLGGPTGAQVTASLDAGGKIVFTNKGGAGTAAPTVDTLTGNTADIGFGAAVATNLGVSASGTGNLASASGTAAIGTTSVNTNRSSLAAQYKAILDQITQLAGDSSYNGVNLLNDASSTNKLHIAFSEKNSGAAIDIQGQDATSIGLGLKTAGGLTAADGDFQLDSDINNAMTQLAAATVKLRGQASTLGSNLTVVQTRQDFTKNLVNVLQTGSANLVNADLNEEAANSQALSTRQSLAISSLSLANQAQQGVLQLLK
jgi:flagellin-like hook-associated protein FlgL